jgi:hypothetical protein
VVKSKEKYNKVLGKLPVHIIEELAPVTDNPSLFEDPYTKLKQRLLAAYGCSKWEKLDSLLNFPKMGIIERPSLVLARLNTLKPQSLEELYMAVYLWVLPDRCREHCRGASSRGGRPVGYARQQPSRRGGHRQLCLPWAAAVAAPPATAAPGRGWRRWQPPWRRPQRL